MEQYDITLGDITEKIEKNNVNAGGSMLRPGGFELCDPWNRSG